MKFKDSATYQFTATSLNSFSSNNKRNRISQPSAPLMTISPIGLANANF